MQVRVTCWIGGSIRRARKSRSFGLGNAYPLAEQTTAALSDDYGITATVIDPRQCTSLDSDVLESLRDGHQQVITLEDGQLEGGWGEKVTAYYANHHVSGRQP